MWETFSCPRFSQHGPPFKFPRPEEFFHQYQFSSHFFSLSLSYLLFLQLYSSFAVNSLGNSRLNSLSSSSCSCRLSSLSSSLYSLSNSSTSSFAFSRFSLLSQVSSSAVQPFYLTKNLFFPLTILLFMIFSTSNSSSPSMMTGFGGIFFCPFTCGLQSRTLLTLTTGKGAEEGTTKTSHHRRKRGI